MCVLNAILVIKRRKNKCCHLYKEWKQRKQTELYELIFLLSRARELCVVFHLIRTHIEHNLRNVPYVNRFVFISFSLRIEMCVCLCVNASSLVFPIHVCVRSHRMKKEEEKCFCRVRMDDRYFEWIIVKSTTTGLSWEFESHNRASFFPFFPFLNRRSHTISTASQSQRQPHAERLYCVRSYTFQLPFICRPRRIISCYGLKLQTNFSSKTNFKARKSNICLRIKAAVLMSIHFLAEFEKSKTHISYRNQMRCRI